MYWYGVPDADGYNLATCIWQSRRHAIAGASRPHHAAASKLTAFPHATLNSNCACSAIICSEFRTIHTRTACPAQNSGRRPHGAQICQWRSWVVEGLSIGFYFVTLFL